MIELTLSAPLRRVVWLPASKSLSNRALLLDTLAGGAGHIAHVAECDDTLAMRRALARRPATVDVGAAGTAMRFLTAYFAQCPGERHVLTGTERMRQRPIGVLVEALRQLGADIRYEGTEGYPPIAVAGRPLRGGEVELPGNVSSQYVSALLMVAPCMARGLQVRLRGEVYSRPYIDMTLALMRHFGAEAAWRDSRTLCVLPGTYSRTTVYAVEPDWSAASYWYELAALSPDAGVRVCLPGLRRKSLQGDSAVAAYFEKLGVHTAFDETEGAVLTRRPPTLPAGQPLQLDLAAQPDLAQTLVVACAMLRRPFRFTGLESLRIKETDRLSALQAELRHFGIALRIEGGGTLRIDAFAPDAPAYDGQPIATYADHRMAMSFAPAALRFPGLRIAHPEVVSKSYPDFWRQLCPEKTGGLPADSLI